MALFVDGMNCSLCTKPMRKSADKLIAFGPFIANPADPLFRLSDGIFHDDCARRDFPLDEALRWHDKVRAIKPADRICVVCGELIRNPDDYFGTGILSRDDSDPLYAFNFIHLHRTHAGGWPRLGAFVESMQEAHATGRWTGADIIFDPDRPESLDWNARWWQAKRT